MQQVTAGMFSSHEDKEQNAKCKSLNPALLTAPVNNMYDTCVLHVLMQRRQKPTIFESFASFRGVQVVAQTENVLATVLKLQSVMQQDP